MFIIATVLPINMGALAFVGAFGIALIAHLPTRDIFAGFPGDLFVTLVGITYLFAIAQNNGTVDWLVRNAVWLVRGRVAAIPWVMFVVAGVLTAVGAFSPAAVAIIAPIALRFAHKYEINPLMMGLMVIHGAQGGGFSPISVYGGITNKIVEDAGLPRNDTALFLASLAFNSALALLIYLFFRRRRVARPDGSLQAQVEPALDSQRISSQPPVADTEAGRDNQGLTPQRVLTLIGLIALGVGSLAFDLNVGLVAISVAVLLAMLAPNVQKNAVDQISWSTVLLITGVVTYVSVLQKIGTVATVGVGVTRLGVPLLGALLLCYISGGVSAFASSVAVLGASIPLAVPFLLQGHVQTVGVVAAIAVSTTIVDVSPFSTNGALVVANAKDVDGDRFYRHMLVYTVMVVAIGPFFAWLLLILPGWL